MKTFFVEITEDHQIKGQELLLKAFRSLKPGRYRNETYNTNKRSLNQNSYVHVVFTLAQKGLYELGYDWIKDMEDAKSFYKEMFLTIERVNEKTGEVFKVVRKTRDLSKEEMSVFVDQVRDHQLEWCGVYIPAPDEHKANYSKWDLVGLAS
jgi:hypothetical protein